MLGPSFLGCSGHLYKAARQRVGKEMTVFHQHGIWTMGSVASTLWRRSRNGPLVIAPHGALEPWSIRRSRWKKRIAKMLYEEGNLRECACFHAVSEFEVASIKSLGYASPIALMPNCVPSSWVSAPGDGVRFRLDHNLPPDSPLMFFLGRITPKKGLLLLIEALTHVRNYLKDWILVIGGPDEFGHEHEVRKMVSAHGLDRHVRFVGPLFGQCRLDAFAAVQVFVLPSYSEGSPLALLEALGRGVPVITTDQVWCPPVQAANSGWVSTTTPSSLGEILSRVLVTPQDQLRSAGERGRAAIVRDYTWEHAANRCIQLYGWLTGDQLKPEFVV